MASLKSNLSGRSVAGGGRFKAKGSKKNHRVLVQVVNKHIYVQGLMVFVGDVQQCCHLRMMKRVFVSCVSVKSASAPAVKNTLSTE